MKNGIKCIVKNEKFEIDYYLKTTPVPSNCAISDYDKPPINYSRYQLFNGVVVNIVFDWDKYRNRGSSLLFTYNDFLLKEVEIENFQSYADHMNVFNEMDEAELDAYVLKAQNKTKTTLEEEIEELKLQKSAIKEELKIYIEIQQKRKDLKKLIKKLDS